VGIVRDGEGMNEMNHSVRSLDDKNCEDTSSEVRKGVVPSVKEDASEKHSDS
jgi:hypothetical protein